MFDSLKKLLTLKTKTKEVPVEEHQPVIVGKVIYLPFGGTDLEGKITDQVRKFMWGSSNESEMVMFEIMDKTRLKPIVDDIRTRFRGKQIGLRGIMAMVGGETTEVQFGNSRVEVADLETIMLSGTEHIGANEVLVASVGLAEELGDELPLRVEQYLCSSAKLTLGRTQDNAGQREVLMPVILVYDISPESGLAKGGGYNFFLPTDQERRSKVIIGAYPVDIRNLLLPVAE